MTLSTVLVTPLVVRITRNYVARKLHGESVEPVLSYDEATQILREQGYYTDTHYGRPFEYGKGWALHEIPEDTVRRIIEIIEENRKKINSSKIS